LLLATAALVGLVAIGAATVYAVTESRMSQTFEVEPVPLEVSPAASLAKRGKEIATFRGCRDCHGPNLTGRLVTDGMPVMRLAGPNITPAGVTRDYDDRDWARTIRHGVRPDGTPVLFMPSYEWTELSHEDLAALIAYAKSVPAVEASGETFAVGPLGRVLYLAGELPLIPAETIDHSVKPAAPPPGESLTPGSRSGSTPRHCR
jgi:mono/diheme cytochrome c family protein